MLYRKNLNADTGGRQTKQAEAALEETAREQRGRSSMFRGKTERVS